MVTLRIAQRKPMKMKVVRKEPELVRPAKPTPKEIKELSDIDDQKGLWYQMPTIIFYRANESMRGNDPIKVVREGLAKALVFYYPLAGRLRARPGHDKLVVDCNGEGALFIEADAETKLEDFGDEIRPPLSLEELFYDVPGTHDIVDTPPLIVQVTRFKCGGFTVVLRLNHVLCDAAATMLFMSAVSEMARGLPEPLLPPVWQRELLNARSQPRVTYDHHEYAESIKIDTITYKGERLEERAFILGAAEISALRSHIRRENVNAITTFEILSAVVWRCRTIALELEPTQEVHLRFYANARSKFNPPLPKGYYGNAIAFPVARATAGEICTKPISYILELIKKAKQQVTEEYIRSMADLMVIRGRPPVTMDHRVFDVSDLRHYQYDEVDFGWGKPVYAGPPDNGVIGEIGSYFISFKSKEGENMIVVPMVAPSTVMKRFEKELRNLLKARATSTKISSAL